MAKTIHEGLSHLNFVSAIFGLVVFEYPVGRPMILFTLFYIFSLWTLYLIVLYTSAETFISNRIFLDKVVLVINLSLNFFTAIGSTILGLFYRKKLQRCLARISAVDDTLETLGISKEYSKLYRSTRIILLMWFCTSIILFGLDTFYLKKMHANSKSFLVACAAKYGLCVTTILHLHFSIIVGYVGSRFHSVNKRIRQVMDGTRGEGIWVQRKPLLNRRNPVCEAKNKRVLLITMHLHLEVCKILREVNTLYEVQMTFEMGSLFIFFVYIMVALYLMFLFPSKHIDSNASMAITFIIWTIAYFAKFLYINYVCESVYSKANSIKGILDRLMNSEQHVRMQKNLIKQFNLQLMQRPIRITGLGLFYYGYDFVRQYTKAMATVLIIILQMNPSEKVLSTTRETLYDIGENRTESKVIIRL